MSLCDKHQESYDAWLTRINDPWRGQCYRCLAKGGTGYAGCINCTSSLADHRREQRKLRTFQLDLIEKICKEHQ